MEEQLILEVSICRVCLKSSDQSINIHTLMITHDDDEPKTYFECLKECTQLDFKLDDDQPNHICFQCSNELSIVYEFMTKARMSFELLSSETFEVVKQYESIAYDNQSENQQESDPIIEYVDDLKQEDIHSTAGENDELNEDIETVIESFDVKNYEDSSIKGLEREDCHVSDEISIEDINDEEEYEEVPDSRKRCNLCSEYFSDLIGLMTHGDLFHKEAYHVCDLCYDRFTHKYALNQHIKEKHKTAVICNICLISVPSNKMRAHKRQKHNSTIFLCSACPRTFTSSTGLRIHSETHKENRQREFQCEQCNKKFLTERTFKVHVKTHWEERNRFKCQLCDKEFLQKINLKLHMQMHRGGTMACNYCDKKFVRKSDLAVHLRFHTGNFPYECKQCDKRFAIVGHLNYHMKRHEGFVYKCDVCDKEFINKSGLRNHSFQHTSMPFSCLRCGKGFPTKFKIRRHLKTVHHVEENEDFERLIIREVVKKSDVKEEAEDENTFEEIEQIIDGPTEEYIIMSKESAELDE